jgi:hypothetical protein
LNGPFGKRVLARAIPGIHVLWWRQNEDGRDKPGHDLF